MNISIIYKVWDEINFSFLNLNAAASEIWEWINNRILHIMISVIINPCWD